MNKHSSGPWVNDGFGVITGGPNLCTSIAETPKCNWTMRGFEELAGQAEANARLISAAPDLLAALEMVADLPGFAARDYYGVKVLEAIARARGEA